MYAEDDFLQLSGLQHYKFCRRQWALIHLETQWHENYLTADGRLMHENAHDVTYHESRGDTLTYRGMNVFSARLGASGQCDVVEFRRDSAGVTLAGRAGKWLPYPVEYKRGDGKSSDADSLQLCAQAMCLEEMLCCSIPEGALFYGAKKRRQQVTFTDELRREVEDALAEMHSLYSRGYTPKVKPTKSCNACSMKDICLPELMKENRVGDYLSAALAEDGG